MKEDFFFLHQSFEKNSLPIEIILTQTDSLFEDQKYLLQQKFNLPVKSFSSIKDCHEYLITKISPFCLITKNPSEGDINITAIIRELKKDFLEFTVIMLHKEAREAQVIEDEGIYHLNYPFSSEKLLSSIHRALQEDLGIVLRTKEHGQPSIHTEDEFNGMLGMGIMKKIFNDIKKNMEKNCPILISGHPGTGKKLLAKTIFRISPYKKKHIITINCNRISSDHLTDELLKDNCIILDGIHQMSQLMQKKMLKFLKSHQKMGMGRVIATCDDLNMQNNSSNLIDDFLDFLGLRFHLPPLSKRTEDIPLLISLFISRFSFNDSNISFNEDALEMLSRYPWSYNVQELSDLVEEMSLSKRNQIIRVTDLPFKYTLPIQMAIPEKGINLKSIVNSIESTLIEQALKKTRGNKQRASKLLGINRTTLIEKMKKKGMRDRELILD